MKIGMACVQKEYEVVLYPEFFWAYQYMYQDEDFNESIEECTVRQIDRLTDQQKLWLYLAVFRCQTTKQS